MMRTASPGAAFRSINQIENNQCEQEIEGEIRNPRLFNIIKTKSIDQSNTKNNHMERETKMNDRPWRCWGMRGSPRRRRVMDGRLPRGQVRQGEHPPCPPPA